MRKDFKLSSPLDKDIVSKLNAGDSVLISGTVYTARDAAHKKMIEGLNEGKELPFDIKNAVIYFAGPAPAKKGEPIGSVGPTTSYRMDAYSPITLKLGVSAFIGKGKISKGVIEAMIKYKAVYIGAIGGAGALLSSHIIENEVIAYPELGAEAVHKLTVKDFPGIVVIDSYGNNLYETEYLKYKK